MLLVFGDMASWGVGPGGRLSRSASKCHPPKDNTRQTTNYTILIPRRRRNFQSTTYKIVNLPFQRPLETKQPFKSLHRYRQLYNSRSALLTLTLNERGRRRAAVIHSRGQSSAEDDKATHRRVLGALQGGRGQGPVVDNAWATAARVRSAPMSSISASQAAVVAVNGHSRGA